MRLINADVLPGNEPLTVEQLREMVGQWVWVIINYDHEGESYQCDGWAFIPTPALVSYFEQNIPIDFYGKKFLAYAYPPDHIDREAWVSVKERMPNKGKNVLVFAKEKFISGEKIAIDRLEKGEQEPVWMYTHGWFEVTHWMPLPKPPAELKKRLRG